MEKFNFGKMNKYYGQRITENNTYKAIVVHPTNSTLGKFI